MRRGVAAGDFGPDIGAGTTYQVKFPVGGFAEVGVMNVTVRNKQNGTQATRINGFEFLSPPEGPQNPIDCSASRSGGAMPVGDLLVLLLAGTALAFGLRRKKAYN